MIEICHLTAAKIAGLEVLNETTARQTVADLASQQNTRIIITDQSAKVIYDSATYSAITGDYALYPEIVDALEANDVFTWQYRSGAMQSYAATPVISYGTLIGCIYLTEYDTSQGALIASIQNNIFYITALLEIVVIIFSFFSSNAYSRRLKKIMSSIRTVRGGDYSHKINMSGHDELNVLSNEFNDLISRLQTSENKRSQFVSDASHELKTPLASIKLLSDSILQNSMDESTIKEFVGDIGDEADRLNRMTQKLLALSRIDTQEVNETEIVQIAPTIRKVVRMLSEIASKNNITIETTLSDNCPVLILEDDLHQVIYNLAENGIKYNVKNGKLFITIYRSDDNAIIKIKDTGVGIPEDSLSHIFERFYRVDKARSRSTGGSGLGLSIVRNIVKRNNGDIQVKSIVGEGTEFTIIFPIFDTEE